MSTNEKVIDNVRYQMSQSDYNMIGEYTKKINEILARATVVEKGPVVSAPRSGATPVVPEPMTEMVMARFLYPHYCGRVVIYDNENHKLLTRQYYGKTLFWDDRDTRNAAEAKKYLDANLPGLKVARTINMQVASAEYPGFAKWSPSGKILTPVAPGMYVVCNYIVLNEKTGLYELLKPDAWLGARRAIEGLSTVDQGCASSVAAYGCNPDFQAAILAARGSR